jgi:hypothetical protein
MKKTFLILLLFFSQIFCQDYLNIQFNNEADKHSLVEDISEITVSVDGSEIIFSMTNGNDVTKTVSSIIDMTFGNTALGDVSLPVELVSFNAVKSGDNVALFWTTASEVNNHGFAVERTHSGIEDWEKIGFVEGEGSSSTSTAYSYNDENIQHLSNIKYRLKQIDYDGSYEYSEEISVAIEKIITPKEFKLHNNYPNPFNPKTTITYDITAENLTILKIYDMVGREVKTLVNKNQKPGNYKVTFNGQELASGIYFCRLTSGNHQQLIKMLLVK